MEKQHAPPVLCINGTVVGELRYTESDQPWFRGVLVPSEGYRRYAEILDNLNWKATNELELAERWKVRNRFERLTVKCRYPSGESKTLNRTLFQLNGEKFSHRMCAEAFLQCFAEEMLVAVSQGAGFQFLRAAWRYLRLRGELFREELLRRIHAISHSQPS